MSEVIIKSSHCPICGNLIQAAGKEHLKANTKARNDFKNDVFKHNLVVKEMPLAEFKAKNYQMYCEHIK